MVSVKLENMFDRSVVFKKKKSTSKWLKEHSAAIRLEAQEHRPIAQL